MGELTLISGNTGEEPVRPTLIKGGVLIGRATSRHFGPEDFEGNNTLLNLSNQDIYEGVRGQNVLRRKKTLPKDIVRAVLRVTHDEIPAKDQQRLSVMIEEYTIELESGLIDLSDRNIVHEIDSRAPKLENLDLMRGMTAFSEAEYYQHQGNYEFTLVAPARRLANWMILRETEVELI